MGELKHDGGPAFPRAAAEHSQGGHYEQDGMSMRDYFAAQALPALLSELYTASRIAKTPYEASVFEAASLAAYETADAMIAARKATPSLHEGERG